VLIKRHSSVSRQVHAQQQHAQQQQGTPCVYASRLAENTLNYCTSITAEPIIFLIGLIDSLGSNYIIKVSLFFFCVSYKRRYHDAKSKHGKYHFVLNIALREFLFRWQSWFSMFRLCVMKSPFIRHAEEK